MNKTSPPSFGRTFLDCGPNLGLATLLAILLAIATPNLSLGFQDGDATDATSQSDPTTDTADSSGAENSGAENSDSENSDSESKTAEATEAVDGEANENSLMDKVNEAIKPIDKMFGDYLVTPLETAFFFDFFTGPRTDKDGAFTSTGWLGVSLPFVVIWLLAGAIFLTLRMGFINVRAFWHAIRLTKGDYDDPEDEGEVSHFQALSSALSATVGLGNIAGVAIAIGSGGPGATLWMVLIGLLGMSSKFTECTLGQLYRRVDPETGRVSGGPMRYLKEGIKELNWGPMGAALGGFLSLFFAILCIGASLGGGNAFQVGQSLDAIRVDDNLQFLDNYPWVYGLALAIGVGVVIVGGIKSIGQVASRIVPFMCAAYVVMALYIIFTNFDKVGPAFQAIWNNAFNLQAGMGAILGVMVVGIQRAVFSNEAGVGSAAIAHSAAKTDEPVSEGIVALLEPFIDTVVICTMTAIVIIIAGGEWVATTETNDLMAKNYGAWSNADYGQYVSGVKKSGAALTVTAVSGEHGLWIFRYILYAAVILFAYSTLISWYYYGERCWTALLGEWSSFLFKILFLSFTVLGSIVTTGKILEFSDLLILSMALPNMLGLFLLSGRVKGELDNYLDRLRSGKIAPRK